MSTRQWILCILVMLGSVCTLTHARKYTDKLLWFCTNNYVAWYSALLTLNDSYQTASTECFQSRNCGLFCCPPLDSSQSFDVNGFQRTECCSALSSRSGCCSPQELQTTTCISGRICPDDSGLDDVGNIRNQCCLHFRDGCCSRGENRDLQFLWVCSASRSRTNGRGGSIICGLIRPPFGDKYFLISPKVGEGGRPLPLLEYSLLVVMKMSWEGDIGRRLVASIVQGTNVLLLAWLIIRS